MTQNRERLVGVGVGKGAVVGPVVVSRPPISIPADEPARGEDDVVRVHDAFDEVAASLEQQAVDASDTLSQVLAATAQMASDPVLRQDVAARIRAGSGPARAVHDAVEEVCATLEAAGGYLAERTTDLRSVRDRVVARVLDVPEPGVGRLVRPSVIVATDLSPADTAALEISQVLAIVTELGGPTSHTAIIAAQLGIPCVVQVHGAAAVPAGTMLAVDASAGYVVLNPDDTEKQAVQERRRAMEALAGDTAPGATSDGHSVALLANVGTVEDALSAADGPAEGVGLLRTEVLFLNEQTAPRSSSSPPPTSESFPRSGTARSSYALSTPARTSRSRSRTRRRRTTPRSVSVDTGWCARCRTCSTPSSQRWLTPAGAPVRTCG